MNGVGPNEIYGKWSLEAKMGAECANPESHRRKRLICFNELLFVFPTCSLSEERIGPR